MNNCVLTNTKEFKSLYKELYGDLEFKNPEIVILASKVGVWQEKNGLDKYPSKDNLSSDKEVQYLIKSVEILSSDKAKQVFEKGNKNSWTLDKILNELQIPREQKQLILDSGKTDREDIITDLLANYSYTIEVNIAGKVLTENDVIAEGGKIGEYVKANYYANLTVPGGTNYTENEIATPAITPSIKGHAQFSTDNGLMWSRTDEKVQYQEQDIDNLLKIMENSKILQIKCS
jgi:hypothetical protein